MNVLNFINITIPSLEMKHSAQHALDKMEEIHLNTLPILTTDGKFYGMANEDNLLSLHNDEVLLETLPAQFANAYLLGNQHYLDAFKLASSLGVSILAVVNEELQYVGCISIQELALAYGQSYHIQKTGSIIVLSMNERDFSLAQISRLIEANNVKILSCQLDADDTDPQKVKITIKLDTTEVGRVIATLERFSIVVAENYGESGIPNIDMDRLGSLLKFLSI